MKLINSIMLVLFLITGCTYKPVYSIGVLTSSQDIFNTSGIAMCNAVTQAVNDFNSNNNVKIDVIIGDDEGNEESAKNFIKKAVSDSGIKALIGPLSSEMSCAIIDTINQYEIPTIIPVANVDELKSKDDFLFTNNSSIHKTASATAKIIMKKNKTSDIILLLKNQLNGFYNDSFSEIIYDKLNSSGYNKIYIIPYEMINKTLDEDSILSTITLSPRSILILDSDINTAVIAQTIKLRLPEVQFYGIESAISQRTIERGGKAVDGMFFTTTILFDPSVKKISSFLYEYKRLFGVTPDAIAYMTYLSTSRLLTSMKESNYKQEDLKKNLLLLTENATKVYDIYGDVEKEPVILQIQRGAVTIIDEYKEK